MQVTKISVFKILILKYYESTDKGVEKYYEGRTVYASNEIIRDYLIKSSDFSLKVWSMDTNTPVKDTVLDNKLHLN